MEDSIQSVVKSFLLENMMETPIANRNTDPSNTTTDQTEMPAHIERAQTPTHSPIIKPKRGMEAATPRLISCEQMALENQHEDTSGPECGGRRCESPLSIVSDYFMQRPMSPESGCYVIITSPQSYSSNGTESPVATEEQIFVQPHEIFGDKLHLANAPKRTPAPIEPESNTGPSTETTATTGRKNKKKRNISEADDADNQIKRTSPVVSMRNTSRRIKKEAKTPVKKHESPRENTPKGTDDDTGEETEDSGHEASDLLNRRGEKSKKSADSRFHVKEELVEGLARPSTRIQFTPQDAQSVIFVGSGKEKEIPKRPINAFMAYVSHMRSLKRMEGLPFDNKEFIREMGVQWKKSSRETHQRYRQLAETLTKDRNVETDIEKKGFIVRVPVQMEKPVSWGSIPNTYVWNPSKYDFSSLQPAKPCRDKENDV